MKWFDFTQEKYNNLLLGTTILTNFLHRCHIKFTYEIIGNQIEDPTNYN